MKLAGVVLYSCVSLGQVCLHSSVNIMNQKVWLDKSANSTLLVFGITQAGTHTHTETHTKSCNSAVLPAPPWNRLAGISLEAMRLISAHASPLNDKMRRSGSEMYTPTRNGVKLTSSTEHKELQLGNHF